MPKKAGKDQGTDWKYSSYINHGSTRIGLLHQKDMLLDKLLEQVIRDDDYTRNIATALVL